MHADNESAMLWDKLVLLCAQCDELIAAQTPQFRDRYLQQLIWQSLTIEQRWARLCELCDMTDQLRAMECVREPDGAAADRDG